MQKFLTCIIIVISCLQSAAQGGATVLKFDYNVKIEIIDATLGPLTLPNFVKREENEQKIPCEEEIQIKIRVTNVGTKAARKIPLTGAYFLNGKKVKDLELYETSRELNLTNTIETESGLIEYALIPFYEFINPYSLLIGNLPSTKTAPRIHYLGAGKSKDIIVTAPFVPSGSEQSKELNMYKFQLGEKFYTGMLQDIEVNDSFVSNNKAEINYWKHCKTDRYVEGDTFFEDYFYEDDKPEIVADLKNRKIVSTFSPNPVLFKQWIRIALNPEIPNPRGVKIHISGIDKQTFGIQFSPVQSNPSGHIFFIKTDQLRNVGMYQCTFTYPGWNAEKVKFFFFIP
ncbi:hypothetical protein [Ekhidna sp.]|uniref:hypothetical protein n=1 Tax=Ekhidna sp. TaxID=2608089 RepID=UPI003298164C